MKNSFISFFKELLHRFFGVSEKHVFTSETEKEKYRISHIFDIKSENLYYEQSGLYVKKK